MQQFSQYQIICPVDGASDAVQKVSAIVHGAAVGGRIGAASPATLVQMLTHNYTVKKAGLTGPEIVAVAALAVAIVMCACSSWTGIIASSMTADDTFRSWLQAGGCITAAVLLYLFVRERRNVRQLLQETPQSNLQKEHYFWEQLYYCHRHDVVFLPGLSVAAPPQKMHEFLREAREAMDAVAEKDAATPAGSSILETKHMDGGYMV